MTTSARTDASPHFIAGACIMLLGVLLALDRLNILPIERSLQFWPLGLVLIGGGIVWQALRSRHAADASVRSDRGRSFPFGFVILLTFMAFVAGSILDRRDTMNRTDDSETVSVFAVLCNANRMSTAAPFRGADLTTVLGSSRLDLRQATIGPGEEAVIDVFGFMGRVVVRVPNGWDVDVRTTPVIGRVADERVPGEPIASTPDADTTPAQPRTPRVVIRGNVVMGRLVIRS